MSVSAGREVEGGGWLLCAGISGGKGKKKEKGGGGVQQGRLLMLHVLRADAEICVRETPTCLHPDRSRCGRGYENNDASRRSLLLMWELMCDAWSAGLSRVAVDLKGKLFLCLWIPLLINTDISSVSPCFICLSFFFFD